MNLPLEEFFTSVLSNIRREWLWVTLAAVFLIFLVISLFLIYHWHRYGRGEKGVLIAELIYFIGSAFLLSGAAVSIVLFSSM